MRKSNVWLIIWIGLFWGAGVYVVEASVIIHDAAFSPDGQSWGAATSLGFQQYDRKTRIMIYTHSIAGGIRFLKWVPNSNRVLLVSWQDKEVPTYSLLDIEQDKILWSFQDELRWYYYHMEYLNEDRGEFAMELQEGIYPDPAQLGITSNLTISPDGQELAYITHAGNIIVRDTSNGIVKKNFLIPDSHLVSLGYTEDMARLWAGVLFEDMETIRQGRNELLFFDSKTGELLDVKKIIPPTRYIGISDESVIRVYNVRPDLKYALAISMDLRNPDRSFPIIYARDFLINLETGEFVERVGSAGISGFHPKFRGIFVGDSTIYDVDLVGSVPEHFFVYDYQSLVLKRYPRVSDEFVLPSQPIAPDGREFILVSKNNFYLVNTNTVKVTAVSPNQTQVNDMFQYDVQPNK